jgi:hypothetical protein
VNSAAARDIQDCVRVRLRPYHLTAAAVIVLFWLGSCGGGGFTPTPPPSVATTPATPPPPPADSVAREDAICHCTGTMTEGDDYRHDAKHVLMPTDPPQEITVATMLSWETPPQPAFRAGRTGRELQNFHIARAYLWFVWLTGGDCDIHMEIADVPDRNAPRVIVETPNDSPFCINRYNTKQQLAARNIEVRSPGVDLQTPLPVEVLGPALQDFNHPRGTTHVGSVWELHPAILTVLPQ